MRGERRATSVERRGRAASVETAERGGGDGWMGVEDGGRKRGEKGEDGGGCGLLVALPSRSPAGGGKDCSRLCLLLSGASSLPASLPSGGNPADAPALRASESVTPKERRRAGRSRASFVLPPAGGQKQSSSVRPSPRSRRHGKARLVCSTRMPRNASATQGSWNSRRNLASATHAPTRTHTSLHGRAACIRRKTDWPGPVCSVRQRFPARVGLLPPSSGAFAIHRQPTSDDVGLQATSHRMSRSGPLSPARSPPLLRSLLPPAAGKRWLARAPQQAICCSASRRRRHPSVVTTSSYLCSFPVPSSPCLDYE